MCKKLYQSDNFILTAVHTDHETQLTMELLCDIVNTRDIPDTSHFLENHMPGVLNTQCFNEHNYSFKEEVKQTEIGHLFEHLVLDELCRLKVKSGAQRASFSGLTSWNWEQDPRGVFHITIDIGHNEGTIFKEAIQKCVQVIESLLSYTFRGQPDWLPAEVN